MLETVKTDKFTRRVLWRIMALLAAALAVFVLSGMNSGVARGAMPAAAVSGGRVATSIELHSDNVTDNSPFKVHNMVPGDFETKNFAVRLHHDVPIRLKMDVIETLSVGSHRLAEVLEVRVYNLSTGETLFDGMMDDLLGQSIILPISPNLQRQTDVYYGVETFLPTRIGNDYQRTGLEFDLVWSVEGDALIPKPPYTGDAAGFLLALLGVGLAGGVALLLYLARKKKKAEPQSADEKSGKSSGISKKIFINITAMVVLVIMLTGTTFALYSSSVAVRDNELYTGYVEINLNDNRTVFDLGSLRLEPSTMVTRPLTIKNVSSTPIYYEIYMENVNGALAQATLFHIYDDGQLIKTVTAKEFTADNPLISEEPMAVGAENTYQIEAVMNRGAGNSYQDTLITFDFVAVAVQSKNNPNREF